MIQYPNCPKCSGEWTSRFSNFHEPHHVHLKCKKCKIFYYKGYQGHSEENPPWLSLVVKDGIRIFWYPKSHDCDLHILSIDEQVIQIDWIPFDSIEEKIRLYLTFL